MKSEAQPKESDKLYWKALKSYTNYLDTAYKDRTLKPQVIYLKQQDFIDSIPRYMNGYKIELITNQNYKSLYKQHGGHLTHTVMFPVKLIAGRAEINVIPYSGTLKRKDLNLGLSDGVNIIFKFNCDQGEFFVSDVKAWGI
ncbi:hypothetical protein LLH06_19080 [Mucilaginibacter daejeonensis]|uniref:hypothetical protein n=1 Tax=Mucilaginibacter daejeonensis TaxID=398049 RepID=UPI001D173F73|nr:hypothetical protein [Mucilaginibacter daejeonensis]UEG53052.1 hypothetical protein LLH06_19080 [Mucilaginibacter daejeonensis]